MIKNHNCTIMMKYGVLESMKLINNKSILYCDVLMSILNLPILPI